MNNFEKYNKLHDEVINRLADGEITIETAKEVIDLSFDKYIVESSKKSKNNTLYFLSDRDMDGKTLNPRVPNNFFTKNNMEDDTTPRVCLAPDIKYCLRAISAGLQGKELFVHIPINEFKIHTPSIKEVPDAKVTHEVWALEPVTLKKIGKIKVGDDYGPDLKFTAGDKTYYDCDFKYKWIEKEEITIEMAREINDLAFEKYIEEKAYQVKSIESAKSLKQQTIKLYTLIINELNKLQLQNFDSFVDETNKIKDDIKNRISEIKNTKPEDFTNDTLKKTDSSLLRRIHNSVNKMNKKFDRYRWFNDVDDGDDSIKNLLYTRRILQEIENTIDL